MKNINNKKSGIRITEGNSNETADVLHKNTEHKIGKLKKPLIFGLMGVVFLACMYLIFNPSEDKKEIESIGLNDTVPQATGSTMPENKGKAYELEMQERKEEEKRKALTSLSDYWNTENKMESMDDFPDEDENYGNGNSQHSSNSAVNSYRNMQSTLDDFYQNDNSETIELRKQLDELREQLAERDESKVTTVDDQLALMEKSYEMAAKYLPTNAASTIEKQSEPANETKSIVDQKAYFVAFTSVGKNTVSALYREPTHHDFLANLSETRNRSFYTVDETEQHIQPKNSIKASVLHEQKIIGETNVRLRLLEAAKMPSRVIPQGTIVTANAKFQGGRLQLKISSIELEGTIIPVDITIYDLDGQQGLYVPYSFEMNALTEMAGNMSQQSGTSLMMTQNAKQQIAADLSRGVVQGVSGYFAKKVRTPKVTLKAGHQVFLVSK